MAGRIGEGGCDLAQLDRAAGHAAGFLPAAQEPLAGVGVRVAAAGGVAEGFQGETVVEAIVVVGAGRVDGDRVGVCERLFREAAGEGDTTTRVAHRGVCYLVAAVDLGQEVLGCVPVGGVVSLVCLLSGDPLDAVGACEGSAHWLAVV